ncbi:MAG: Ig-like domain-containing protein [Gemmatimonadetes bacterium]|nr:Ig-like domain-containing protein [Gemmatimonadota bacterium]
MTFRKANNTVLAIDALAPWSTLLFLVVLYVAGCGGSDVPMPLEPSPPIPGSIIFTPQIATLTAIGDQQQFEARVWDQRGNEIPDAKVTWSTTRSGVAEIGQDSGLATATGPGTATIRAASGRTAMEGSLTVNPEPPRPGEGGK